MDRWTLFLERIRPFSFWAFLIAIACLAIATSLRFIFGWFGVSVVFATYYPAVLLAALAAGTPAGILVTIGSLAVAWWAFVPPYYEFNPVTASIAANFTLYVFSCVCIVALAQLYRNVLQRLRQHDRERELLMQEMEHRGRNTYAVVESIVRSTLVHDRASADAIAGRVRAVSAANDLVNQSGTKTVRLKTLLSQEFAPNADRRLRADGPNIEISADAARKLGLVFHELATNAMKHGALASPEGRVVTSWQADSAKVLLSWKEEGGPPVAPPPREGFGTVIVTQSLKSLSGDIAWHYKPDGLNCEMTFDCH